LTKCSECTKLRDSTAHDSMQTHTMHECLVQSYRGLAGSAKRGGGRASWLGVGHARRVPADGALRARSALRPDRSDTPHILVGAVFAAALSGNGSIDIPRNVLLPRGNVSEMTYFVSSGM